MGTRGVALAVGAVVVVLVLFSAQLCSASYRTPKSFNLAHFGTKPKSQHVTAAPPKRTKLRVDQDRFLGGLSSRQVAKNFKFLEEVRQAQHFTHDIEDALLAAHASFLKAQHAPTLRKGSIQKYQSANAKMSLVMMTLLLLAKVFGQPEFPVQTAPLFDGLADVIPMCSANDAYLVGLQPGAYVTDPFNPRVVIQVSPALADSLRYVPQEKVDSRPRSTVTSIRVDSEVAERTACHRTKHTKQTVSEQEELGHTPKSSPSTTIPKKDVSFTTVWSLGEEIKELHAKGLTLSNSSDNLDGERGLLDFTHTKPLSDDPTEAQLQMNEDWAEHQHAQELALENYLPLLKNVVDDSDD